MTPDPVTKELLIKQKLQLWHNTHYDAVLDAHIAEQLNDEQARAMARNRVDAALRVVAILEDLLASGEFPT